MELPGCPRGRKTTVPLQAELAGSHRPSMTHLGSRQRRQAPAVGEVQSTGRVGAGSVFMQKPWRLPVSQVCEMGESQVPGVQTPHHPMCPAGTSSDPLGPRPGTECLWPGGLPVAPPYQAGCPQDREGTWAAIGTVSCSLPLTSMLSRGPHVLSSDSQELEP